MTTEKVPDVEVFRVDGPSKKGFWSDAERFIGESGAWYWWFTEVRQPIGPFPTEVEALADAQKP